MNQQDQQFMNDINQVRGANPLYVASSGVHQAQQTPQNMFSGFGSMMGNVGKYGANVFDFLQSRFPQAQAQTTGMMPQQQPMQQQGFQMPQIKLPQINWFPKGQ